MAQTTRSLWFGLIFVRDNFSPANSGGLNFWKLRPLVVTAKTELIFKEQSFVKLAYAL